HPDLPGPVTLVDPLQRDGIALADQWMHMRSEASLVEPIDALRRQERALRLRRGGRRVGQEVREDHDEVEERDDGGEHRQAVAPEPPPHELPLTGDRYALLGDLADREVEPDHDSAAALGACGGLEGGIRGAAGLRERQLGYRLPNIRIRGSIHRRSRSNTNVPTTVSTPSSSTIVPA